MAHPLVQIETRAGAPLVAGERVLIPMAQVVRLQLPGPAVGGLIWNRPVSVVSRTADGQEQVLPVQDVTRQAQLALLGLCLVTALVVPVFFRRRNR